MCIELMGRQKMSSTSCYVPIAHAFPVMANDFDTHLWNFWHFLLHLVFYAIKKHQFLISHPPPTHPLARWPSAVKIQLNNSAPATFPTPIRYSTDEHAHTTGSQQDDLWIVIAACGECVFLPTADLYLCLHFVFNSTDFSFHTFLHSYQ